MPKKSKYKDLNFNINWQESYGSIILGAIIIVIVGLLIANFIVNRGDQVGDEGANAVQSEEEMQAGQTREHAVIAGDTLSKISDQYYGTMEYWPVLASENQISNPNVILTGSAIKVPPKPEIEKVAENLSTTTYEVQEGDTLFIIAEKVYGDGYQWGTLDAANSIGRLPNGNPLIFAGSTLTVPR